MPAAPFSAMWLGQLPQHSHLPGLCFGLVRLTSFSLGIFTRGHFPQQTLDLPSGCWSYWTSCPKNRVCFPSTVNAAIYVLSERYDT